MSKGMLGAGAVAIAAGIGFIVYFYRANDPASKPPIPYKRFDYSSHMQQMNANDPRVRGDQQRPITP